MAGKEMISHSELIRVLDYSPETGQFTWKIHASTRARIGDIAGRLNRAGYRQIRVDGRLYLAHRLAWFYVNGSWPSTDLDHRDLDKDNNRLSNLRETDDSLNGANKAPPVTNTSGAKGVQRRPNNRWRASIEHRGRWISFGTYGSKEEASEAYLAGARAIHGEFARAA